MATQIQTYDRMIDEIFEEANASDTPEEVLAKYIGKPYFREYLVMATNEVFPDYDPLEIIYTQYDYHRSSAGSQLMNRHVFNVLKVVQDTKTMSTITKKKQVKALLELLYKGEAEALILILTKNLIEKYPKLTIEVISNALNRLATTGR